MVPLPCPCSEVSLGSLRVIHSLTLSPNSEKQSLKIKSLVLCYPLLKYLPRVFFKPVSNRSIQPSSLQLESLRQVPVVESDCRLNVVVQQLIDQVVVVVHSSLVLVSNTRGQHSGPGNGESVALQTQVCQQLNILFVVVIGVTGHLSTGPINDVTLLPGEHVPDVLSLPILIPASLNLISCCGCSPLEICSLMLYKPISIIINNNYLLESDHTRAPPQLHKPE